MSARPEAHDTRSRPSASASLAVGVGAALLVFAVFALALGRSGQVAGALGGQHTIARISCIHAFGASRLLGRPASPVDRAGTQVFHVDASSGHFEPNHLVATAGRPVLIQASAGRGCSQRIEFDELGVRARLGDGGALLRLPALDPGVYPFSCGLGKAAGILVIRQP